MMAFVWGLGFLDAMTAPLRFRIIAGHGAPWPYVLGCILLVAWNLDPAGGFKTPPLRLYAFFNIEPRTSNKK
jgi:hypothetical protein